MELRKDPHRSSVSIQSRVSLFVPELFLFTASVAVKPERLNTFIRDTSSDSSLTNVSLCGYLRERVHPWSGCVSVIMIIIQQRKVQIKQKKARVLKVMRQCSIFPSVVLPQPEFVSAVLKWFLHCSQSNVSKDICV